MIGNLIAILFLGRDAAHIEHLRTTSYAAHMALGDFYSGIVDLADSLAEGWQGRHDEKIDDIPRLDMSSGKIDVVLEAQLDWIEKNRKKAVGDDTALQNIVDEIVALYLSTLYKLRRFK